MNLPPPPEGYDKNFFARLFETLRQADAQNTKRNQDQVFVETKVTFRENKVIITSPNGTPYYLTVSNAGVLGTTAV